ncbi:MAG TPA: xanthine dehydrogenase family protein molybdopterin-binding subunit [Thermoanaerobaculia bacterium]|jgi:xanthine dehydrogenase YagR molybdenum-binding subunit|nr:xanthine dehydrogenase family protein molybdopterin-binding subunit [Thermoanaerobaculia bacterium]
MADPVDPTVPAWPEAADRKLIGQRIARLDGPAKASGRAKYTYDLKPQGMLWAKMLLCPHAHARIKALDVAAARAMPGVKAVFVIQKVGAEIQWALDEVVAVAATSEALAWDAVKAIKIEYEVLPHFVTEEKLAGAPKVDPGEVEKEGDADAALAAAEVRIKGAYSMPAVAHNCMEAHGQICHWTEPDHLTAWCSTQAVSGVASQFAEGLGIPAANVRVIADFVGGGFGSKFSVDRWGIVCAQLAKIAGAPVKLMLDRHAELTVAGDRPSAFAEIEVGAKKDGTLTAWVSKSWGSGGPGSAGDPPLPYVFQIPNRRHRHSAVPTNKASSRAWRAPNSPQGCYLSMSAIDDLAAALGMNPLDVVIQNLPLTGRLEKIYREELEVADQLMGWRQRWHPRGDAARGPVKRGLGLAIHTWGGRGHRSNCEVTIHPDATAEAKISTQDIGTGTRTVVAIVLADTLGLPLDAVQARIGDSRYPASGGSGGSTTVGGVSSATRRAALNALGQVFARVAPALKATPAELEAVDGKIRVKAAPERAMTWKQAMALFGRTPVTAAGANPGPGELTTSGVGGVQMADVAVDVETGVVKIQKMVAVQDCGLIVDLQTTESQVYGSLIMGISTALAEEKVTDPVTGITLNHDFETYRMAGIGDVGELVVRMMTGPGYDERGVIGVGEPPMVSPLAAIANAVANAIGVRVPWVPLTPRRVLDALAANGANTGKAVA